MAYDAWRQSERRFNAAESSFNERRSVWDARVARGLDYDDARTATIRYLEQTRTQAITYANAVEALFREDLQQGTVGNHRGLWETSVARVTLVHNTLLTYTAWLPNTGIPLSVQKVRTVLENAETWAQQRDYYAAQEAAQQGHVVDEGEDGQAYIKQEEGEQ